MFTAVFWCLWLLHLLFFMFWGLFTVVVVLCLCVCIRICFAVGLCVCVYMCMSWDGWPGVYCTACSVCLLRCRLQVKVCDRTLYCMHNSCTQIFCLSSIRALYSLMYTCSCLKNTVFITVKSLRKCVALNVLLCRCYSYKTHLMLTISHSLYICISPTTGDDTYHDIFRDFSQMASNNPEKLKRRSTDMK